VRGDRWGNVIRPTISNLEPHLPLLQVVHLVLDLLHQSLEFEHLRLQPGERLFCCNRTVRDGTGGLHVQLQRQKVSVFRMHRLEVGRGEGEKNQGERFENCAEAICNVRTCNQPHLPQYPRLNLPLDGIEVHRSRSRLHVVHCRVSCCSAREVASKKRERSA
jgi:hypothetical protein